MIRTNEELQRGAPIFGYRAYEDLYSSVRMGDWKLLGYRSGKAELYNLAEDIAESTDLSPNFPDRVDAMKAALIDWEKQMNVFNYSGFKP